MADGDAALPSQRHAAGVARGEYQDDPAQRAALAELDRIHAALRDAGGTGVFGKLLGRRPPAPRGLYLWGGVGRGKTFLVDLFFAGLPTTRKRRTHFHRFMRNVHERLHVHAGERDPLARIAREWRDELQVLVLDEFFVSDIGDAMLLGRLLERLFAEGVVLVTTSNIAPSGLYKDGLQRARFLPAIGLLERHCVVLHLDSPRDYRLRELTRSPVYRQPLDAGSDAWLEQRWHALGGDDGHRDAGIVVDGRRIAVRARSRGMAWFDFDELCDGPRSQNDYIEIAREFRTVLVGGVPVFTPDKDDQARRFINLVDEFYDRNVKLVLAAAAPLGELYAGGRLGFEFQRTVSRLVEMQSYEYLGRAHRA